MIEKRNIEGFPGYKVDRDGNIYGQNGKKMKPFMDRNGYMRINLRSKHKLSTQYVRRLVCKAFRETKFSHKNITVRLNKYWSEIINSADRFRWGMKSDCPRVRRGRTMGKTTKEIRDKIRKLYRENGYTQHQLAEKFKVAQGYISVIVNYKVS